MYKINEGFIQLDNMIIPLDPANRHYKEFLDLVIENGVADIADAEL